MIWLLIILYQKTLRVNLVPLSVVPRSIFLGFNFPVIYPYHINRCFYVLWIRQVFQIKFTICCSSCGSLKVIFRREGRAARYTYLPFVYSSSLLYYLPSFLVQKILWYSNAASNTFFKPKFLKFLFILPICFRTIVFVRVAI